MKNTFIFSLMIVLSVHLSAQQIKGSFMVEGGIKLKESQSFIQTIGTNGISFYKRNNYTNQRNATENIRDVHPQFYSSEYIIGYSFAPKIGYFIFNHTSLGVDFQYNKFIDKYFSKPDRYRTTLYGVFIRQYFGNRKLVPFLESGTGFGLFKSVNNDVSAGGGYYQYFHRYDLFYISGSAGISYSLNSRFSINLQAKAQRTSEKPTKSELQNKTSTTYYWDSFVNYDSALFLSLLYFVKK
jgi:hypothetical protein